MGRESKIRKLRKEGVLEPVKIDKKKVSSVKKLFIWIVSVFLIVVVVFGLWAYSAKDIEASVNGAKVTTSEVDYYLRSILQSMQSQGMDPTAKEQQATINRYRSDIINMLIEQRLFELYAKENKITLTDEEIQKKVDEELEKLKSQYSSEEEFNTIIAQSELKTIERLKEEIAKSAKIELLEEKVLKPIYDEINVTEEEAKIFFNAPSQISAQRILIKVDFENAKPEDISKKEEEIKSLKDRIYKNEISFDKAVEQYSEDEASKPNQGNITLYENAFPDEPELFEEAKKLKVGEISNIIKTKHGYNLLKVNTINYNKERYDIPESAQIKSIIIAVDPNATQEEWNTKKTKADGLVANMRAGKESFETIAELYSSNPELAKNPQTVYSGQLEATLNETIFNKLKVGEISDPVQTQQGYQIIQLVSKEPPQKAVFEKVKDKVITDLTNQKKMEARKNWLEEQKKKRKIKYSNPWVNMTSFFKNTFGGPFEDLVNWFKQYTVEPKQETTDYTQEGDFTIPIEQQGEEGLTIPFEQNPPQEEEFPITP
ncbi:MAG TPA: peptidylprolyl isomerase [Caldisericia bacterium]|nr:peptidylprolyl isomerase [Caldisericia bacterium]